jgi:hypothetical protein
MHDLLRERLWRQIEALPEAQLYQVLDYIEFLTSKYARENVRAPASAIQRFGERLEDQLRVNRVGYDAIRGTLNVVGAADRVMTGLAEAGRSILREVNAPPPAGEDRPAAQLPPPESPSDQPTRRSDIIIDG